jgi:hypothetical protein
MTTYKNVLIATTGTRFSFDVVSHNWMRPNTYRKNTVTNTLATVQNTITYYLSEGAEVVDGIVYLPKFANSAKVGA